MKKLFILFFIAVVVSLASQAQERVEVKTKTLYDFGTENHGWWTFSNVASLKLSTDIATGAGNSSSSLKALYKYGDTGAYLGFGIESKWAMGKETWNLYSGGHMSVSFKSDAPCSVRIELRAEDKATYSITLPKIPADWTEYSIPFAEFRSEGKKLDLTQTSVKQIVLIPSKTDSKEHSFWVDNVLISEKALNILETSVNVSGKASDPSGNPAGVAEIFLYENADKDASARTVTDSDGSYSFSLKLKQRRYVVSPSIPEPFEVNALIIGKKEGFLDSLNPLKLKEGSNSCNIAFSSPKTVTELRVAGNRLQTPDGKEAWLQGLCIDSLQWSATGENILQSISVATGQWKANAIRLPVKDNFWFGKSEFQKDGGEAYRKLIDAAIETTATRGAYLILDLHRFGAPMPEHTEFWKDAAKRYKDHPAVLFELFNEAHGISWEIWRNGGDMNDPKNMNTDINAVENNEKSAAGKSVGMQALVDAVRSTGAKNIVIAGGLDWGYDLSGIMNGFALDNKDGNGIMYSSHIYPWKSDWEGKVLIVAEKYPLFIGEVGCQPEPMEWQKSGTEDTNTWAPDMIGFIQKNKLNWTGFSFHPGCGPRVISDWQYTPTPYWGIFVKDALSGKQFEMKKMR